ncbi:5-(carboxyamino)imidazole ribonucleotide synthase [Rhizobium sp. EC-SD404]|uniref:5-(carboxyamino)imidazole ribonucleotide synthase n=1 Tax=Rhizobium sp. EC-SD404 TaxID=2038389 RepID=UPI001259BA59|nr:5-(carboxyamino)imidazole ribonucleotide synthase [Rhizobium sp. EC-SD404]VVT06346.1 N5-carboxyaminoimidazole ribonucleotide synthase [Rhizobium sp. EC-SD404]
MSTIHLPLGSTIGIVGGGQLGRMLAIAAARLGYRTVVLEPQADCPAAQVANRQIIGAYDNLDALEELASSAHVLTYEFENVPVGGLTHLSRSVPVFPPVGALEVSQDRLAEKQFFENAGIATAPYRLVDDQQMLEAALAEFNGEGILKTRRLGYDGKGQRRFSSDDLADDAFADLGSVPAILEAVVPFEREVSVIAVRGRDGEMVFYDPAENVHRDGILATSTVPASISDATAEAAIAAASAVLESISYVGVIGIEFFVLADGRLIANEMAPRVHNSGHWTEAACLISQFENHIRAVAGLPLGSTARHGDCEMYNLLGREVAEIAHLAAEPDVSIHIYGKGEARAGRKMGHYTRVKPRL